MNNIQEKAEQYARKHWGDNYDIECQIAGCEMSVGEISSQDYTSGYNEAMRWIPVGERLPEYHRNGKSKEVFCKCGNHIFVGYYDLDNKDFGKFGGNRFYSVDEWREI